MIRSMHYDSQLGQSLLNSLCIHVPVVAVPVMCIYLVQRPAALSSLSVLTALLESLKSIFDIFAASSAADELTLCTII
jgi:hypothetical protein